MGEGIRFRRRGGGSPWTFIWKKYTLSSGVAGNYVGEVKSMSKDYPVNGASGNYWYKLVKGYGTIYVWDSYAVMYARNGISTEGEDWEMGTANVGSLSADTPIFYIGTSSTYQYCYDSGFRVAASQFYRTTYRSIGGHNCYMPITYETEKLIEALGTGYVFVPCCYYKTGGTTDRLYYINPLTSSFYARTGDKRGRLISLDSNAYPSNGAKAHSEWKTPIYYIKDTSATYEGWFDLT